MKSGKRMKAVPIVRCRNMKASLSFYTTILGFALKNPEESSDSPVMDLIRDNAEIQLSILAGDGLFGSAVNIVVEDVDDLFRTVIERGLDTSRKKESPVHQSPVNQTWGRREFYVDDPDGNTLRFTAAIGKRFASKDLK